MTGFVSIIGAGPGDPELLTLKAARRLAQADRVLYDALVAPETLDLAPAHARRIYVGKRARRRSMSQAAIEWLMVRAARRGEQVVRLKGGDPFVFGRGGEEALALAAAGIPFEVVPGISSSIAAPALAGIPVTHRGLTSAFTVVSGHAPEAYRPVLDALAPNSLTVVVLMGLAERGRIASVLLERGWRRETPAAISLSASRPDAQTWIGTLSELATAADGAESEPRAGVLVVGEVVSLAERIRNASVSHPDASTPRRPHALSR
ncbi:MAG: uroporphyrinogen-III C-methyltransferase [Planctomycetes bacterium]|nr:uroporphyrinogen-III C-methyltransferase [Planctomycetota bacterium]